jgi:hypothetical protein
LKYALTEETIEVFGVTLHRIRYLADGELGGWLESEKNLVQDGDAWVYGDAQVSGNAQVSGDARVYGDAQVYGNAWEVSPLQIQGTKYFFSVSSKTSIAIGCHNKSVDEWIATYAQEFNEHDFTEKERIEYKRYFNLAVALYGWKVALLPLDEPGTEVSE